MQRISNSSSSSGAVSRRHFAGILVPGLYAFASPEPGTVLHADQALATNANRSRTSLHLEVDVAASPARILNALIDEKQFAAFTGFAATIDAKEGGAFSLFEGLVEGRNIEVVSGIRLVQAWRTTNWDDGVYSLVKFEFKPRGTGSTVALDQTGFPEGSYDHLALGWNLRYWQPMKKFFA